MLYYKYKWDLRGILSNPGLPLDILEDIIEEENLYRHHWGIISQRTDLSIEFLTQHRDKITNDLQKIAPIEYVENCFKKNWDYVSENPNLTERFILENINKFNWTILSSNISLTVKLIKTNWSRVCLDTLPLNPNITYRFIVKYKLSLYTYAKNVNAPLDVVVKNRPSERVSLLSRNNNLTKNFCYVNNLYAEYFSNSCYRASDIDSLATSSLSISYLSRNPNIFEIYFPFLDSYNLFPKSMRKIYANLYVLLRLKMDKDACLQVFRFL